VVVSGNPSHTERFDTVAHLEFVRDHRLPLELAELASEASVPQNALKARQGMLRGLRDEEFLGARRGAEARFRAAVGHPEAWSSIDQSLKELVQFYPRYYLLCLEGDFHSQLFALAQRIIRGENEVYLDAIDRTRETANLAATFSFLRKQLGSNDPTVRMILGERTPAERAAQLVQGTAVDRIPGLKDPMLALARRLEPEVTQLKKRFQEKVAPGLERGYTLIAKSRLLLDPIGTYPEATFTPRFSFGKVCGYGDLPFATRLADLFASATAHSRRPPFQLPSIWERARPSLDLNLPLNFASTADVVSGQSGSPVVNRDGEWVGVVFDSNQAALILDFGYSEKEARALAVDVRAILEALDKVYHCPALIEELRGHRGT
jgi:hypothetical protein